MRVMMLAVCALLMLTSVAAQSANIPGNTIAIVNLRSGPGTGFDVVSVVEAHVPVTFTGRNDSSTWLYTVVGSKEGWLSYTFVNVDGRVNELPVVSRIVNVGQAANERQPSDENTEAPQTSAISPPADAPVPMGGVVPFISDTSLRIFRRGQVLGNRPDVFSKVGDSITATDLFLDPVGHGGLVLDSHAYLRPVVDFFSQTPARDHASFANTSLAARSGWTSGDLLDPSKSYSGVCLRDESPLVCEYRSVKPSVALIMVGTNDVVWVETAQFEANLNTIVQTSIDMGVIPVISTIPDQPNARSGGRVHEFNQIIREVARRFDVPLWDYWEALQGLPNLGLGEDDIHPSHNYTVGETAIFTPQQLIYGYNMRNLTALMVLDAVWRSVIDPSA